jgi:GcrA cell cycle regulator
MWDDGATATQIGLQHGRSKNSIIGYVHRWHLPPRPSPITVVYGPPRPPRNARLSTLGGAKRDSVGAVRGNTLAPLSSLARRTAPIIPPKGERVVRVPQPRPERPHGRVEPCCFPIGEPGTKGFRYCDDPSEPGRPYCSAHMKVAYIRTPRISMAGLVA